MATDPLLQTMLDRADSADSLNVLMVLKPRSFPSGTTDLAAQRAAMASAAKEEIAAAIARASAESGQPVGDSTIFGNLGTARLSAPAGLITALAGNPAIASISLDR